MSAQTTISTDNLVETMANLTNGAIGNLVTFAELLPELWALAPWNDNDREDDKSDIAGYMTETFGIGSSRDGLLTLPQIALDAAITAFVAEGTKLTYSQLSALTGASRATVARASARGGMSDAVPQRSPNQGNSDNTGEGDESGTSGSAGSAGSDQEFDLPALLSALSDSELKSVLSAVGVDRVRKVLA